MWKASVPSAQLIPPVHTPCCLLLKFPLSASAFKGKGCTITACASKPLAHSEHVSAWCVPDRPENPRCVQETHMTAFIHFSLLRCKDEMTSSFRKSIKEQAYDRGGGIACNVKLEKAFKCGQWSSLKLLPNPLLPVPLSASSIDYFYVIYSLAFLLMDTSGSSPAFNVSNTHWSGPQLIGHLLCCQVILCNCFCHYTFLFQEQLLLRPIAVMEIIDREITRH